MPTGVVSEARLEVQSDVHSEVQTETQSGAQSETSSDASPTKSDAGTAKSNRHDQILDAAEVVLRNRGFEKATMDEIAEQADVAKGTLYLYFKNKHAIYLSLSERGSMLLNAKLGAVLSRDQNGLALIRDLGKTYLRFIHEYPLYFTTFGYYERVLMHQAGENADLIERCEKQAEIALRTIVRALQIGMQDGSVNPEFDPEELGLTIWGASKGVIHMAYLKDKQTGTDTMITNFIRIIGSGIKNDEMTP
jgi:AcrR family transcriptional regulator